jgi:hypothetical protein
MFVALLAPVLASLLVFWPFVAARSARRRGRFLRRLEDAFDRYEGD